MLSSKRSFLTWLVVFSSVILPGINAQCNPLTSTCPPNPGLTKNEYSVDFTKQSALPEGWILANYATVKYGANGAEFTFNKRYDAPYIWTNFYILFGQVEVVMQAAPGIGIISSAVLMSDIHDEIDWEWSGNNFASATGRVQTNYFGKGITGNYDRGTQPAVDSPTAKFHTYTFDWTPTALTWSIDGHAIRTLKAEDCDKGTHQYPQSPSRLHLGVWDAGDPDTNWGTANWAGGYTDFTKAPFTAYVQSVKITNTNPCSQYEYSDQTGNWHSIKCTNTTLSSISSSSITSSIISTSSTVSSASSISNSSSSSTLSSSKMSNASNSFLSTSSSSSSSSVSASSGILSTYGYSSTSSYASPTINGSSSASSSTTDSVQTPFEPSTSTESSFASTVQTSNQPASGTVSTKPITTVLSNPDAPANMGSQGTTSYIQKSTPSTSPALTSTTFNPSSKIVSSPPSSSATTINAISSPTSSSSFKPTTSPTLNSITSPSSPPKPTMSTSTSSSGTRCHFDNCLRNLQDLRYSGSASALCKTYTTSTSTTALRSTTASSTAIPSWLAGCSGSAVRVTSACGCLNFGVVTTAIAGTGSGSGSAPATATISARAHATGKAGNKAIHGNIDEENDNDDVIADENDDDRHGGRNWPGNRKSPPRPTQTYVWVHWRRAARLAW